MLCSRSATSSVQIPTRGSAWRTALALETPVLATNVGLMSSIFPNELLVEPNNQKKLQKFLEMYVDEIDLFNQKSIFEYVLEIFSIENQISQNN